MMISLKKWLAHLHDYLVLMRLDKPIGILLLLWPTLWAVWIASNGRPTVTVVFVFVMGTILARSGGCVLNDLADREFDGRVARTKNRPLVTGAVSSSEAIVIAVVCFLLAFLLIIGFSALTIGLAFGALFLSATYPFMKRYIAIPQAYLGIAFSFGVPMAFAAIRNALPLECWGLMLAGCFWALAYDTEYAMVDRDDDVKIGIKTSAITFGKYDTLAVVGSYAVMQVALIGVGHYIQFGWAYYAGLLVALAFMGYHYVLIRQRDPLRCFRAFNHNAWVGMAVFIGIAADYGLRIGLL